VEIKDFLDDVTQVFLHKTTEYEHYIEVTNISVRVKIGETYHRLLTMSANEEVLDMNSIGNALVIITTGGNNFFLFKDGSYQNLGKGIPTPDIEIETHYTKNEKEYRYINYADNGVIWQCSSPDGDHINEDPKPFFPEQEEWNNDAIGEHSDENIRKALALFDLSMNDYEKYEGGYVYPMFVRYAVETFDGQLLSCPPILCGAGIDNALSLDLMVQTDWAFHNATVDSPSYITVKSMENDLTLKCRPYQIHARLKNREALEAYGEIIKSVNIYMSPALGNPGYRRFNTKMVSRETSLVPEFVNNILSGYLKTETARVVFNFEEAAYEDQLMEKSGMMRKVLEVNMSDLSAGKDLYSALPFQQDVLLEQESLAGEQMMVTPIVPQSVFTYNNRFIFTQPSKVLNYGLSFLNSSLNDFAKEGVETRYDITWTIKGTAGTKVVKKTITTTNEIFGFQTFPDRNCQTMDIKMQTGSATHYASLKMKPHPYLNCAYAYDGFNKTLASRMEAEPPVRNGNAFVAGENKIQVSKMDDPFVFPPEGVFTFQAPVVGVATAGTPLSQGQFGDNPLYVFTEDGVWAMTVDEEGNFRSTRPSERYVCNNPASITVTEAGILFSTDNGLILLREGTFTNLTLHMKGSGYKLSEAAKDCIRNATAYFRDIDGIVDQASLIEYMKSAYICYDAAGQRLILVSDNYPNYQYVFYFETATWHKMYSAEYALVRPINSFPECHCVGYKVNSEGKRNILLFDLSTDYERDEPNDSMPALVITRPFDLDNPDVYKVITDVRIRGKFRYTPPRFMLEGSNDGVNFYVLNSLRGKSWKLFRLTIVSGGLEKHDRISWIDVMYETRFTNRLR
jgi:hypothetical protein